MQSFVSIASIDLATQSSNCQTRIPFVLLSYGQAKPLLKFQVNNTPNQQMTDFHTIHAVGLVS